MAIIDFFAVFCDDIRREADGRFSLMGVYPGFIAVPSDKPRKLRKVCMQSTLVIQEGCDLSSLKVDMELNGSVLREIKLPPGTAEKFLQHKLQAPPAEDDGLLVLNFVAEVRDIAVTPGMKLRAAVNVDNERRVSTALNIEQREPLPSVQFLTRA